MVQLATTLLALAAILGASTTNAHPGEAHHTRSLAEIQASQRFHQQAHRSLAACANHEHALAVNQQAAARRLAKIQQLRALKQQQKRQKQQKQLRDHNNTHRRLTPQAAADVLATSHLSSLTGLDPNKTASSTLFGTTNKCVLEPEVTEGPYYVKGELIRNDIRETQQGVDLYAELQFVNVNDCAVVPNYYVDFWHCNSTGVYSGVVASSNGNSNDLSNIDATHSRGLYATDTDGVVQFTTKFPGHYTGRATHIHILGHYDGTVLANNTYSGGSVSHVGQIFFDQDLITQVEKTAIYATNTQTLTTNARDSIFTQSAATGFDPVLNYVLLGDSVEDGIFAWISVGVDMTVAKSVSAAATMTETGGVASTGTNSGGFGGRRPSSPTSSTTTRTPSTSGGSSANAGDSTVSPSAPSSEESGTGAVQLASLAAAVALSLCVLLL